MNQLTSRVTLAAVDGSARLPVVFQEDWWLQAASRGRIERAEVVRDGGVIASLAFLRDRRMGFRRLRMPPYTRTLGPVFTLPPSKPFQQAQTIRRLLPLLLDKLPPHDSFRTTLDPADPSALAFSLAGAVVKTVFTFRSGAVADLRDMLANCDPKTRNLVTSGAKRLAVERDAPFERFVRLSEQDKARGNIHDFPLLEEIFAAARAHGAATVLAAVDDKGRDMAACVLVWGAEVMFLWLTARRPDGGVAGAGPCLLAEGVRLAGEKGLAFDLDGYSSAASGKYLASFGLPPVARQEVFLNGWAFAAVELVNQLPLLSGAGRSRPDTRVPARRTPGTGDAGTGC